MDNNVKDLLNYLNGNKSPNIDDIVSLLNKYPYFQCLYVLLSQNVNKTYVLEKAAIYSNNRAWLKEIVESSVDLRSEYDRYINSLKRISVASIRDRNSLVSNNKLGVSQVKIIESFIDKIKSRPISSIDDYTEKKDLAVSSTDIDDYFVSEFYAVRMLKKGKKKLAISIYQKLILKMPEKKAYFMGIINKIEN